MGLKKRCFHRFDDIGIVESTNLCQFPGHLDNVSREGIKVHYKFPVLVDFENDYEIKVTFARFVTNGTVFLLCHPCWVKVDKGMTEIGFKVFQSKDYSKFLEYVQILDTEMKEVDND